MDWLQSGRSFHRPTAAPKKGRSPVSWRQANRRERRTARNFRIPASPPRCQQTTALPRKFSGVSGQLRQGGPTRPLTCGPATPLPTTSVTPRVMAPIGDCANLTIEKRFAKRNATREVRLPSASAQEATYFEHLAFKTELHALNGNASSSAAGSFARTFSC